MALAAKGEGMHPGKPIIWPTGKQQSTPVSSTPQTQTPGQVKSTPTQATPTKPSEVAPTDAAKAGTPTATPAKAGPSVARPLTVSDIRAHLLNIQVNPTDFNTKLSSLMLRNGVELSRANFVKILSSLQTTNKSQAMQEAADLLDKKGID